ncbi:uncharacterized protein [Salminus brasiliensis]|uniref:uncharacterized protein isoform X1 n=1 Tax=Salminus brasiliensis TaxID=930266 RepID=UPI003B82E8C1
MTVKILLFFTLYLMSVGGGASREVTGYPGGGVLIKCKYERSCTSNPKYFCKDSWTRCGDQVKTGVSNEWKNTGRFSLLDNTRAAEFWVLIRELTVEDSRTYQCAVDIEMWPDDHTPVKLKIQEDLDQEKSITVNGHVGGSVNISCKYPRSSSSKPKFLCRRVDSADCYYKASVKESRRWIKEGKFSLYDDRAKQTFTVSINNLTNEDSGEYWCGAESDWESDHGYKVYITQINLRVTEKSQQPVTSSNSSPSNKTSQNTKATTSSTSKTITNASLRTETPTGQDQPVRSSISPPRTSSLLSTEVTSSSMSKTPDVLPQSSTPISLQTTKAITLSTSKTTVSSSSAAGVARPASSVIPILAVILMLVLIGLLFFIVTLIKRRNTQDPASTQDQSIRDSLNNSKISHTVCDYEEIKDPRCLPASETGVSTVYSTVHLPTDPLNTTQTVYDNVQLPTSPCNVSNPVYSTVPQHSSVKSAEDPAYATVNFCKNDVVTTATTNKEDSCDYATVKHVSGSG